MKLGTKFIRTGAPILKVDDAGGFGLPVMFQHGLCGYARQTLEAFPNETSFFASHKQPQRRCFLETFLDIKSA